jgi:hypothetical protein
MKPVLHTVTVERLEEIERERNRTLSDPLFYRWMHELRVSSSWQDPTPLLRARNLMGDWDTTRFRTKH